MPYKRLILFHNKNLNKDDYLIDDRDSNLADDFNVELIHFEVKDFLIGNQLLIIYCKSFKILAKISNQLMNGNSTGN